MSWRGRLRLLWSGVIRGSFRYIDPYMAGYLRKSESE
jgi:hypothetical protein